MQGFVHVFAKLNFFRHFITKYGPYWDRLPYLNECSPFNDIFEASVVLINNVTIQQMYHTFLANIYYRSKH